MCLSLISRLIPGVSDSDQLGYTPGPKAEREDGGMMATVQNAMGGMQWLVCAKAHTHTQADAQTRLLANLV